MKWITLHERYNSDLVEFIENYVSSAPSREISPQAIHISTGYDIEEIKAVLNAASDSDLIDTEDSYTCPNSDCNNSLSKSELSDKICFLCDHNIDDFDDEPKTQKKYFIKGGLAQDVSWVLTIHGMKSHGAWQEDLSWILVNRFKYNVPVLSYKFGYTLLGVLSVFSHKKIAKTLGHKISLAVEYARKNGKTQHPDVIVHSFGSLVFSTLLELEEFSHLKFRRVIIAGGIIRPDFEWAKFIESRQVETVFNHCGKLDKVVQLSEYFIPNSGPSGIMGFEDKKVYNFRSESYSHSTFFVEKNLIQNLSKHETWDILLRYPINSISKFVNFFEPSKQWKPLSKFVFLVMRTLVLCLFVALLAYAIFLG